MILYFFIVVLLCTYQPLTHSAAGSEQPRTSGLALMRLQPEFKPIVIGYDSDADHRNFSEKAFLVEQKERIKYKDGLQTCLKRQFCYLFIRGAEATYRDAMLKAVTISETDFHIRAYELKSPDATYPSDEDIRHAQEDAQEFPVFYHPPHIVSYDGKDLITAFMHSLEDDDLKDPRFSELTKIHIAVVFMNPYVRSRDNPISWTINDEHAMLTKTLSSYCGGSDYVPRVHFVMCTKAGRDFAEAFLVKPNVKEMHRRKLYGHVYQEFLACATEKARSEGIKFCGVAVLPSISTLQK